MTTKTFDDMSVQSIEQLKKIASTRCRCAKSVECKPNTNDCALQRQAEARRKLSELGVALDDTGVPDVVAMMARLKLTTELASLRKQIAAVGDAPTEMLTKLKLVSRANQIRKELGASLVVAVPEPTPEPVAVSPHVATLKDVAAGLHDSKGLPELYGLIQEAVNGLDEAGELTGDAEAVANDAITHWAELEERLSAHV